MTKTMISARIPEKLNADLDVLAEKTSRSKAFLVTKALEDYVERQAWLVRRIEEAVKVADENGEWIADEDMRAWLMSWGKPDELPPPPIRKREELP
jgi:predicted transcriptional regulator